MNFVIEEAEINKIDAAIEEVKKNADIDVVTVVVAESDDYPAVRWRVALAFALLITLISFFVTAEYFISPYLLLGLQIVWLGIGYFISRVACIRRFFLVPEKIEEEVRQRAIEVFFDRSVHCSETRRGLLIFVSLLERRAEILPDIGLRENVSPDDWKPVIQSLVKRARSGELVQALVDAVHEAGTVALQSNKNIH